MKLTVYVDMLIMINTLVNYFLLKTAAVIGGISYSTKRIAVSAFTGAMFSVCIFAQFSIFIVILIRASAVRISTYIAFGFVSKRYFFQNFAYLVAVNMIFTGAVYALSENSDFIYFNNLFMYININPFLLVICVCAVYTAISVFDLFFNKRQKVYYFDFEIYFGDSPVRLKAFYDTGFNLKDILGHRAVVLCCFDNIKKWLPDELTSRIEDFFNGKIESGTSITPVFYSDISSDGILPAVRPLKLVYKNRNIENVIVAFTERKFSQDVRLIFGKEILSLTGE